MSTGGWELPEISLCRFVAIFSPLTWKLLQNVLVDLHAVGAMLPALPESSRNLWTHFRVVKIAKI